MSWVHSILNALASGIRTIWGWCVKAYKAIVNFFGDIFDWLRGNGGADSNHDAFVVDMKKMLDEARSKGNVVNLGLKSGAVGTGTYNNYTNDIDNFKVIDASSRDSDTEKYLGSKPLVILE